MAWLATVINSYLYAYRIAHQSAITPYYSLAMMHVSIVGLQHHVPHKRILPIHNEQYY